MLVGVIVAKYTFEIEQTNNFLVVIEADNAGAAVKEFDEYIVDDFGDPETSIIKWFVR